MIGGFDIIKLCANLIAEALVKFPLIHKGYRFFFFTFVVTERRPILSCLVRGEKRPELTARGERIVALWKRLNEINVHFIPSDFIIMPDHIHLLLIVHSATDFNFNPVVFAHWFQEMTADEKPLLDAINLKPRTWDFVDFLSVKQPPLSSRDEHHIPWTKDFWISISFDARQLSAIRRYIKMNPTRYFWKHDHPDLFKAIYQLRHPLLEPALAWSAIGDITILASPFLYLVRLTRKKTLPELEPEIQHYLELAQKGWIPVCGFISPGEREFEYRLKQLPQSRWIKTVPYALPDRYDPSVEDSCWIACQRQLILSSFKQQDFPPFKITRAGCLLMNERIEDMIKRAHG